VQAGDQFWALRAFRELDDALLAAARQRAGDRHRCRAHGRRSKTPCSRLTPRFAAHRSHWLVREIVLFMKRTLKRMDLTSRTFFAFIEPGSAFAGSLFELALASDRSYMFHDDSEENVVALSPMNAGPLPMSNGLTRLETRFLGEKGARPGAARARRAVQRRRSRGTGPRHLRADEIDWDDEVRARGRSPHGVFADAMTGLEANLRFARAGNDGDEDLRPAHGVAELDLPAGPTRSAEKGALRAYGEQGRPECDWKRT